MKSQKLQIILIELKLCRVLVMNLKNKIKKKKRKKVDIEDNTNRYVRNNKVKWQQNNFPMNAENKLQVSQKSF